jgi:hypothetical protein
MFPPRRADYEDQASGDERYENPECGDGPYKRHDRPNWFEG